MSALKPKFWTEDKEKALKIIASIAKMYATGKNRNWQYAVSICKKEFKSIGYTLEQLRKVWGPRSKTFNGICFSAGCTNRIQSQQMMCPSCYAKQRQRSRLWAEGQNEKALIEMYLNDKEI